MNTIILPHGSIKLIIEKLNVSRPTIRKALRGQCSTELCEKIRKIAIEVGGVEVTNPKKN